MPLPLTVSCFSKVQIGFIPFWYWLTWVVPEKRPLNGCMYVYYRLQHSVVTAFIMLYVYVVLHCQFCVMFCSQLLFCFVFPPLRWLGMRKSIRPVKDEVLVWLSVWRGCRLFAYGPADATCNMCVLSLSWNLCVSHDKYIARPSSKEPP